MSPQTRIAPLVLALCALSCAHGRKYQDKTMDFGAVKTVAVLPFANLSRDSLAGERVRDVFSNFLLASGAVYVLPPGEVARGLGRSAIAVYTTPSIEEVQRLGKALAADAVIIGVLKEYGEIRSGTSSANAISMSVQMIETQTGKVIWAASTTQGGIGFWDRLLGGGGQPMNEVTEDASRDLLRKLLD